MRGAGRCGHPNRGVRPPDADHRPAPRIASRKRRRIARTMARMAAHIDRAAAAVARSLLVDTCAITRPDTTGAFDPVTLGFDDPDPVWTGACFVNDRPNIGTVGGQFVSLEGVGRSDVATRVRLPLTCPQLEAGDLITVTASTSAGLVGAALEVVSDTVGSYAVTKIVHARWRRRVN